MATNRVQTQLDINTNAAQANQELSTTQQLLQNIQQETVAINQQSKANAEAIAGGTEGTKKLANGFKGVGLAIKALGIGLLLDALSAVKELFASNQGIVDAFSIAFKSLNIIFNDFVKLVTDNVDGVKKFFSEALSIDGLKKFGTAIKENLVERFNSYLDTIGYIGEALKKLFSGDLDGAAAAVKKAGKESIDVFTGVNNTVDKVSEGVSTLIDKGGKYLENVLDQAKAMQALENRAKIAQATNAKLIEQYDQLAEKQRQLRDDESATIASRIAANDKLGKILDEQSKVMLANANIVLQQAQNNYNLNRTIDNQVKLIEAQTEKSGVLAQIEGFRSEQIVNRIALEKELNELNQTSIDGTANRAKIEREFTAGLIKDNTDRLAAQRKNIELELQAETDRLTTKRDQYKEGTQAYADANQELLDAQQELNNALVSNDKETQEALASETAARITRTLGDERYGFEARKAALDEQLAILNETEFVSEEARTAAFKANSDARVNIALAELQQKNDIQNQELDIVTDGIGLFKLLGEKNKAIQKAAIIAENAAGIAKIVINTAAANAKAVAASPLTGGQPFVTLNTVAGALGVAGTIAATAKALSQLGGGSAGSAPSMQGAGGSAPSFNTVGASGQNQLAETIAAQQGVVKAQVVASEVTTQQALNRQVVTNATFI